ncbi:MAG: pyridoxamine 5'-phosphate oxidase family protein [Actinomycetota bacterium]
MTSTPASSAVTVRRLPDRSSYDEELRDAILDEGLVAHVGLVDDEGRPVVIPMAYARDHDHLLLHGSPASRLLRGGKTGVDLCVTVTLLDGLVLARSTFHHSMNYRSVVVLGTATPVEDLDDRRAALDQLTEHLAPGQLEVLRPSSEKEVRGTLVLRLPTDEFSVKARSGGPVDDDEDLDPQVWAGVIPLSLAPGVPVPDETTAVELPPHLR